MPVQRRAPRHGQRRRSGPRGLDARPHLRAAARPRGRPGGGGSTRRRRASSTPPGWPGEPARQQPQQRAGVAHVERARRWPPAAACRPDPADRPARRRVLVDAGAQAAAARRGSSACPPSRGSCATATGSSHIAPNSAARWEIDLSGGRRERARAAGRRARIAAAHASATGKPSSLDQLARRARPRRRRRSTASSRPSACPGRARAPCRRCSRLPCPSASATCATIPGRLGTVRRSSCTWPPARSASSSRRRSLAARVVPVARSPPASPARSVAADLAQARDRRRRSRPRSPRGWPGRCRSRSRSWRPPRGWRRESSGPTRGSARPRASSRGLGDEHVGQHVRQVADRGQQPVVGVGVDRHRAGAERDDQPVQALVEQARRALARASGTRRRPRRGPRARAPRRPSRRPRSGGRR